MFLNPCLFVVPLKTNHTLYKGEKGMGIEKKKNKG